MTLYRLEVWNVTFPYVYCGSPNRFCSLKQAIYYPLCRLNFFSLHNACFFIHTTQDDADSSFYSFQICKSRYQISRLLICISNHLQFIVRHLSLLFCLLSFRIPLIRCRCNGGRDVVERICFVAVPWNCVAVLPHRK